jgi:putative DNA methylase
VFTYHHNDLSAYYPLAVAVLDAGLTCSASLPCPAEMSASIHINGTGSSIIDTVFVCRSTGACPAKWIASSPKRLADVVRQDLALLKSGGVRPTRGDIRCITFGHLIRLAIWSLRERWNRDEETMNRISRIGNWISGFGGFQAVEAHLGQDIAARLDAPLFETHVNKEKSEIQYANLSF